MRFTLLILIFIPFHFWALAHNEEDDCRGKNIIQFSDYLKRRQSSLPQTDDSLLTIKNDFGVFAGKEHKGSSPYETTAKSFKWFSSESFVVNAIASMEDTDIGSISCSFINKIFQNFLKNKTYLTLESLRELYVKGAINLLELRTQYSTPDATLSAVTAFVNKNKITFAHVGNAKAMIFKTDASTMGPRNYTLSFSTPSPRNEKGELVSSFHNERFIQNKDINVGNTEWISLEPHDYAVMSPDFEDLTVEEIAAVLNQDVSVTTLVQKLIEAAQAKQKEQNKRPISVFIFQSIY